MKTTAALTAKEIRKVLKATYPGVKFSVTSESYSGGDSVRVEYTDFIPAKELDKLLSKYQYGSFNGMEDIYEYSNVNKDIPQTKYLFVTRNMSETIKEELLNEVRTQYAGCDNVEYEDYSESLQGRVSTFIYRMFVDKSYSLQNANS